MGNWFLLALPLLMALILVSEQLYRSFAATKPSSTFLDNQEFLPRSDRLPLSEITGTFSEVECSNVKISKTKHEALVLVEDHQTSGNKHDRRIPRAIHVTVKSRCMLQQFADNLQNWKALPDHSFYLHNDAAIERLLQEDWVVKLWPNLRFALRCVNTAAGLTDIWRAIVLYRYGGIYTDFDNAPGTKFLDGNAITANDQAFFVVEEGGYLSQYFMAAMPGHPLLKLYVEHCISRLLAVDDVESQYVPFVTGPGALKNAFGKFVGNETALPSGKVKAGLYTDMMSGWHVKVAGTRSNSNAIIQRNVIYKKRNLYKHMNMTHFSRVKKETETKETCLERIHHTTGVRLDTMSNVL